jgi:hypothetical protein
VSISKFQEKFLRKGCGPIIVVAMSAVFLGFGFNNQCNRYAGMNRGAGQGDNEDRFEIVKVGNVPVTSTQVQNVESQLASREGAVSFQTQASGTAQAIYGLVTQAAYADIVDSEHIPVTEDALLNAYKTLLQQEIDQVKLQLMMSGKAKDQKDIDAAFKAQTGKVPDQFLKDELTTAREQYSDKDKRAELVEKVAQELVEQSYEAKIVPSDQALQDSYRSDVVKRIFIASAKSPNVDAKIAEVQAALKGGMSFEQAMDKFSSDPAYGAHKKVSDNTTDVGADMIASDPEYKPLAGQQAGFVSGPVDVPGGKAIFKVVTIQSKLPPDFQKNIATYRTDYAKKTAPKEVQKRVQSILTSSATTWDNLGYKVLYEYMQSLYSGSTANPTEAMRKIADEAKDVLQKGDPAYGEPATYAWYLAFEVVYQGAGADKTKLRDERIAVLNAVLQHTEDYGIRMELVDLYMQAKDPAGALNNLIAAAQNNTDYGGQGTAHFGDIQAKRAAMLKAGLVKDADLKPLDAAQASWRSAKADQDKQDAEMRKQAEAEKQKDIENEKANAAAVAAQKAEQEKNAPPAPKAEAPKKTSKSSGGLLPDDSKKPGASGGYLLPGSTPSTPGKGPGGN